MAAQETQRHARVELVSQRLTVAPRREVMAGGAFSRSIRAGTSTGRIPAIPASRPSLKWQLPDGFTVGEMQWPRPERLKNGPLTDYGLQG